MSFNRPLENQREDTLEITSESFPDDTYWQRRSLIQVTDEVIIAEGVRRSADFQSSSLGYVFEAIDSNQRFLKDKPGTGKIFDIGCGSNGAVSDRQICRFDIGIDQVTLVDPFVQEETMKGLKQNDQMDFVQNDGLSFLLKQASGSGNVMTASIDGQLISSGEYLQRMAQEIYRVVPENGYYISLLSPQLEEEARELFPEMKKIGLAVKIFYKKKGEETNEFEHNAKYLIEQLEAAYDELGLKDDPLLLCSELIEVQDALRKITIGYNSAYLIKHWGSTTDNPSLLEWEINNSHSIPEYKKQEIAEKLLRDLDFYINKDEEPRLAHLNPLFTEIYNFVKKHYDSQTNE
ncbi:hypothetical protein ACFL2V_11335 [Pseudomonadota bacterium]